MLLPKLLRGLSYRDQQHRGNRASQPTGGVSRRTFLPDARQRHSTHHQPRHLPTYRTGQFTMTGTIVHLLLSGIFLCILILIGMVATLGNAVSEMTARVNDINTRLPRKVVRDGSRKREAARE
jgi:hypothetical protein